MTGLVHSGAKSNEKGLQWATDIRLRRSSLLLRLHNISGNRCTDSNLEEKSAKK